MSSAAATANAAATWLASEARVAPNDLQSYWNMFHMLFMYLVRIIIIYEQVYRSGAR
jgi:hypothetical protein